MDAQLENVSPERGGTSLQMSLGKNSIKVTPNKSVHISDGTSPTLQYRNPKVEDASESQTTKRRKADDYTATSIPLLPSKHTLSSTHSRIKRGPTLSIDMIGQIMNFIPAIPNLLTTTKFATIIYHKINMKNPKTLNFRGYYFINILKLLKCGDIELNPGPMPNILHTHPATHKNRANNYFIPNTIKLQAEYQHIANTFAPILKKHTSTPPSSNSYLPASTSIYPNTKATTTNSYAICPSHHHPPLNRHM